MADTRGIEALALRVSRFDVVALVRALAEFGVPLERIRFNSHVAGPERARANEPQSSDGLPYLGPRPTLLEALRLSPDPSDEDSDVELTLNLGLLGSRSPLPSYFLKLFSAAETELALFELLLFLEHGLIRDRIASFAPEEQEPDWEKSVRNFTRFGGVPSPCFVDWLFRRVYPELGVTVERSTADLPLKAACAAVGYSELGAAVLGGRTLLRDGALAVTLSTDEDETASGVVWRDEVALRLEREILRVLAPHALSLSVVLICFRHGPASRSPELGRAQVDFDALPEAPLPRRVPIFSGSFGSSEPSFHVDSKGRA